MPSGSDGLTRRPQADRPMAATRRVRRMAVGFFMSLLCVGLQDLVKRAMEEG